MYNFRTDMADERKDIYKKANNLEDIPGVETTENIVDENIKTNIVKIINSEGEQAIGKPVRDLCNHRYQEFETCSR